MAAGRTEPDPRRAARRPIDIIDLPALREEPARVMSVSPSDPPAPPGPVASTGGGPPAGDGRVFLTPRVLDQGAFDELSATLRALVADAERATGALDAALSRAVDDGVEAGAASERLQERLRLGARMLKAFQGQIGQLHATLGDADGRLEAVTAAGTALDERVRTAEQALTEAGTKAARALELRVEQLAGRAAERLEARLAARSAETDRVETRLNELRERAEAIAQVLETAEVNGAAVAHRTGEAAVRLASDEAAAQATAERCAGLARELDDRDAALRTRLAEAGTETTGLEARVDASVRAGADAARRLGTLVEQAAAATAALAPAERACARIESMLERLDPWRGLLLDATADPDGVPEPVAAMVETLRDGVGADLAALSTLLRDLATRVERYAGDAPGEPAAPEITTTRERGESGRGEPTLRLQS